MDIEVISEDKFGGETYKALFAEIMSDVGKAFHMEKASLVLKPEIPLFIFSVQLRTEHADKTIADVANIREEGDAIHITVTDERYAPEIMKELWERYGKSRVDQQTRFDIEVQGAGGTDIGSFIVASGEEYLKEIVGAVWRSLPEGIKNRHTFIDGKVITVVATEEILVPRMLNEGLEHHKRMTGAAKDV
ncbi:MAG: methanogenesis marker 17 protein [Methanomassiliicoccaceae archaeon]|nr:methanogenesis marker 17 protein [Methanomassiliicoccaceae archaeon]